MKAENETHGRKWRWFWGLLFIFLTHVAAVFWFSERVKPIAEPEQIKPLLYIASDEATSRRLAELSGMDPTLFALPSERGFSGGAWLTFVPADMTLSNWAVPPSWLPLDVNGLGVMLVRYLETNRVSAEALLDDLHSAEPFELRIPSQPIASASTFSIEGALRSRKLISPGALPPATNSELITNSIVELSVNGDGIVESAVLIGECGLKSMDEQALTAAKRLAFEPLPLPRAGREAAVPQRGRVVFTWHVVSAALTNGLTASTP